MDGLMNENKEYVYADTPWATCMILQSIFKEEKTPYAFCTSNEDYEGVFKIYSKNRMKIFVEKNGDATLLWKSTQIADKRLCNNLKNIIESDALSFNSVYDVSMKENEKGFYSLVLKKELDFEDDSIDFANKIAYERLLFLLDVNLIARLI